MMQFSLRRGSSLLQVLLFNLEAHQINITTSIGISFFPDDGEDVDTLIKKADISMYKAKERGGNTYHLYTS